MKNNLLLFLKGIIIGLGKIIPGVSGAMLAITFGVYEQGVNAIGHFFTRFNKNFKFLLYLGSGICIGIVVGSKIVLFFLNKFYLETMFLFIGMIIGGLKPITRIIKKYPIDLKKVLTAVVIFIFIISLSFISQKTYTHTFSYSINYILMMLICGLIDAIATVIPGISGTALLMLIGYYYIIIAAYSSIFSINKIFINLFTLIPYGLGMLGGIILIAKLMDYLINNHKLITHYIILGFTASSIVLLLIQSLSIPYNLSSIIIAELTLVIGYCFSIVLDN